MAEQAQPGDMSSKQPSGKRPWLIILLALLPLVLIMGYLATKTYFQDGIPVFIANWEFGRFGQTLPIFNIAVFVALAILIGLLIDFLIGLARRRRDEDGAIDPAVDQATARRREAAAEAVAAKMSAGRFGRLLTMVGAVVVGMALLVAFWALLLPWRAETAVFGGQSARALRVVEGQPDGRLMVTMINDVLLYRDSAYFVPVIDQADPRRIRQFVEFVPDAGWDGSSVPRVDISRPLRAYRLALPAFTPTLYAGSGYTLDKPYEVLTDRPISIQLPYYITAVQLILIGLVILVAAWFQRRHAKRLESRSDEDAVKA